MLRKLNDLIGDELYTEEGVFGHLENLIIDTSTWQVRYFVVDTREYLKRDRVLIPPSQISQPDPTRRAWSVDIKQSKIASSPDVPDIDELERKHEEELHAFYGWRPYWPTGSMMPRGAVGQPPVSPEATEGPPIGNTEEDEADESTLRRATDLIDFTANASAAPLGTVVEVVIDSRQWRVRYVIVDGRELHDPRQVLLSVGWLKRVDWAGHTVRTDIERAKIDSSPRFNPDDPIDLRYEEQLFKHYGQQPYWGGS